MKNFKWHHGYWGVVAIGTVITGLAIHAKRQYNLLEKTSFTPAGFIPNRITLNEADFNIKFKMTNESDIDYYLMSQAYNLYINNNFAAAIKNPNKIYVAPGKTTDVWLNVKFNPLSVQNLSWTQIKDLLLKNSTMPIQLKGAASVKTLNGLLAFNYPVDETFTIKELTATGA